MSDSIASPAGGFHSIRSLAALGLLGLAVLAACSGSTDSGTDPGPDPGSTPPTTLEPTQNMTVAGTLNVERVHIPAGVTVTATAALRLNVTGDVEVAGTLAGDCTEIVIAGQADATITGAVRNVCSTEVPEPGILVLAAAGEMTVNGALIESSSDITFANRPDQRLEEPVVPGSAALAPSSLRVLHASFVAGLPGLLTQGADEAPFTMSNTNTTGGSVEVSRDGPVFYDGGNRLEGRRGRDGESETVVGPNDVTAQGGSAGGGGYVGTQAPVITVREIHGANVMIGGDGGTGGAALAFAETAAGAKAPSATAMGGRGGPAGCVIFNTYVASVAGQENGVHISGGHFQGGKAGAGGEASARGADGQPGQVGGDATATGGNGGPAQVWFYTCRFTPLIFGEVHGDPQNPSTVIPSAHGDGGLADAHGGRGGDGTPANRNGAPGGDVTASEATRRCSLPST